MRDGEVGARAALWIAKRGRAVARTGYSIGMFCVGLASLAAVRSLAIWSAEVERVSQSRNAVAVAMVLSLMVLVPLVIFLGKAAERASARAEKALGEGAKRLEFEALARSVAVELGEAIGDRGVGVEGGRRTRL